MKKILLTRNKYTVVDDKDFEYFNQFKWYASTCGYAVRVEHYIGKENRSKRKKIYLAREIMNAPDGKQVDHINRKPLDNRRSNLRICSAGENNREILNMMKCKVCKRSKELMGLEGLCGACFVKRLTK